MKKQFFIITIIVIFFISTFSTAFAQKIGTKNIDMENAAFDITSKAVDYHPLCKYAILFDMYDYTNDAYDSFTEGNDMIGMERALTYIGYTVFKYDNYTAAGVMAIVSQTAQSVNPADTLLFGFSGNGNDGGELVCADMSTISISTLKTGLDSHAGVNEVLIDADYSGDFISKDLNGDSQTDTSLSNIKTSADFNEHVISVFEDDSVANAKALNVSNYFVMTSTSGSEVATEHQFNISSSPFAVANFTPYVHNNAYYVVSYFCVCFEKGLGLFLDPSFDSFPADTNLDGGIGWEEMYQYVKTNTADETVTQVHPANSTHVLYYGNDYWITDAESNGVATQKSHYVNGDRTEVNTYYAQNGALESNTKYDSSGYKTSKDIYYIDGIHYSNTTYYPSLDRRNERIYYQADGIKKDCKCKYADTSTNNMTMRTDYADNGIAMIARAYYATDGISLTKYEEYFAPDNILKSSAIYSNGYPISKVVYDINSVKVSSHTYYTNSIRTDEITYFQSDGVTIDYKLKHADTSNNNLTLKTDYAINGIIMESRTYYDTDGTTITDYEEYYSNGVLHYKGNYTAGLLISTFEYTESSDKVKETYYYSNGKRKQAHFFSSSTGIKLATSDYNTSGDIVKKTYLYSNGNRKIAYFFSETTGKKYAYSEYRLDASIIKKTYIYSTGIRKTVYFFSETTGNKYAISEYNSEGNITKKTYFYSNGNYKYKYFFSESTGKKYALSEYNSEGNIIKKTYFYSNGNYKYKYFFSESTGKKYALSEYNSEGNITKKTYYYSNGVRQKAYFFSESTGKKEALSYYDTNGDITKKIFYNSDGSIKVTIYF